MCKEDPGAALVACMGWLSLSFSSPGERPSPKLLCPLTNEKLEEERRTEFVGSSANKHNSLHCCTCPFLWLKRLLPKEVSKDQLTTGKGRKEQLFVPTTIGRKGKKSGNPPSHPHPPLSASSHPLPWRVTSF